MSDPYSLSGGAMSGAQSEALMAAYQRQADANAKEIANKYKLGKSEIAARLKIAAQSSKDTRYGIDAERDTARQQIAQAQAEMERIGIPDMEIRRFVAESNKALAEAELSLKREQFLVDTRQKDAQLQLDREQMERVGIPAMEIDRYIAEKSAEMDRLKYGEDQRQFNATFGEDQRQFNTTSSGYLTTPGTLTTAEQQRMGLLQQAVTQGTATVEDMAQLDRYRDVLAGNAGGAGGGGRQATLDREKFFQDQLEQNRRYGLDVSKFGADLASTPDTYFQARRFQGVDVPRLMGGAGAQTSAPTGGPTPGVATMGAYLSGQDPYGGGGGYDGMMSREALGMSGTPYGGASAGGTDLGAASAGTRTQMAGGGGYDGTMSREVLGMPGTPEDDRAKQIAGIAKLAPPSPYDGLNEQDTSTLKLMESIYKKGGQGVAGGEYERLAASGRLGYLQSAGRLLGYDPAEFKSTYDSYRPSQGAANLG